MLDAGLTWIGPPPAAIAAMGSKIEAKGLMAAAGVPVLPELDPATVTESDLPVLVKASAGGGGRGMRIVRTPPSCPARWSRARREAGRPSATPTVFFERYVEAGRHVEVQVLADAHGTVWSLGERECSIQRRHQKVVEEAPSPMVDEALRAELSAAAVAAAKAIGYVGAGTVEFLARRDGTFWFLEINTRLQVEHPVTECVTGVDLVAEQLRIAAGERLPSDAARAARRTRSRSRLYAEDPAAAWSPRPGTVRRFAVPAADVEFDGLPRPGVRLDAGVVDGSVVGVSLRPDARQGHRVGADAGRGGRPTGRRAGRSPGARPRHQPRPARPHAAAPRVPRRPHRHRLLRPDRPRRARRSARRPGRGRAGRPGRRARGQPPHGAATPGSWGSCRTGWRNVPSQFARTAFEIAGRTVEVGYRHSRDGLLVEGRDDVVLVAAGPDEVVLEVAGVEHRLGVTIAGEAVDVEGDGWAVSLTALPRFPDASAHVAEGSLVAPMPGTVTAVHVAVGDEVSAGQPLLVLEAMKMQHPVVAGASGVVRSLDVVPGAQVDAGTVLAVIEGER